ncbi:hypothetical protein QYE76_062519 [Lolium multiflorum]|uniref:Reverse transcriptase/retrotransposon-derived protein RNase H-like domain-containing protein n=1 Tax=Lolium multiflorum TaxID=4521 RepID=A0AAD8S370_LOLMU|nr:hypothetical protein QYE76_062519 [Lolium multiflorum]
MVGNRNECENVDNRTAMHAFIGGLQRGGLLRHKLTCLVNANKLTLDEMINIASDHTAADDDAGGDLAATAIPLHQQKKNRDNGVGNSNKRKNPPEDQKGGGSDMVAMTFQRGGPGGGRGRGRGGGAGRGQQRRRGHRSRIPRPQTYEEYRDMPCLAHLDPATGKSTHTNRNCKWVNDLKNDPEAGYKRARKHRRAAKEARARTRTKRRTVPRPWTRMLRRNPRRVPQPTSPTPLYVKWSEPCTFDRSDHPAVIPKECYALVVSPRIDGIKLPVAFGDVNNYREEMITFEVVPFKSSYHVIFGRPTYHKFHARACYIYNKLKIPGPNGWITVSGDYKKARDCEEGEAAFAESVISGEELQGYRAAVDPTEMQTTKKQISEQKTSFKAAIETKKHDLIEGDSSKQCHIQRTMQRCLKDQIGRNVHAYVDDIAVMTRKGSDLLSDLKETFDNLRRFVSRLGEKALPLYKLLKKTDKFVWDEAADKALQELKNILSSPPILAAPAESEPMLLYIAATNKVISLVIVVVRKEEGFEHGVQRPVYYISEVLTESKQRYPHFQKLAYGVFLGSRKLRHYFQEHPMTVVSKAPLATIINNSDATGRVAKWGIELSAFDINYEARTAIKSQVLADFIADWTEAPEGTPVPEPEAWVMHFDGSKQHQGSGAGVTLKSPTGEELHRNLERRNSVMAAYRDEVDEIAKCFLGYEVKYVRRDDNTAADMLSKLGSGRKPIPPGIFLEHLRVPSVKGANPENPDLAVSPAKEVMAVIPAWTQPFLDYLIDQKLPEDEVHARQIIRRARSYTIVDG